MRTTILFSIFVLALFASCAEPKDGPGCQPPYCLPLWLAINNHAGESLLPEIPEGEYTATLDYEQLRYEINGEHILTSKWEMDNMLDITPLGESQILNLFSIQFMEQLEKHLYAHPNEICQVTVRLICPVIFQDEEEHVIEASIKYREPDDSTSLMSEFVENSIFVDGIPVAFIGDEYRIGIYEVNLPIE